MFHGDKRSSSILDGTKIEGATVVMRWQQRSDPAVMRVGDGWQHSMEAIRCSSFGRDGKSRRSQKSLEVSSKGKKLKGIFGFIDFLIF